MKRTRRTRRPVGCRWRQSAVRQRLATTLFVASSQQQLSLKQVAQLAASLTSRPPGPQASPKSSQAIHQPQLHKKRAGEPIIRQLGSRVRGAGGYCLALLCLALSCLTNQVKLPSNVECSIAAASTPHTLTGASYLRAGQHVSRRHSLGILAQAPEQATPMINHVGSHRAETVVGPAAEFGK